MLVSSGMSGVDHLANLVLVDNPAFIFLIPAVVAATVFDNLVDGQGLQSSIGSQDITVACLAYSRRTGNDDVGLYPRHVYDGRREQSLRLAENKVQYCQAFAAINTLTQHKMDIVSKGSGCITCL